MLFVSTQSKGSPRVTLDWDLERIQLSLISAGGELRGFELTDKGGL
jgi:hypothetical protein